MPERIVKLDRQTAREMQRQLATLNEIEGVLPAAEECGVDCQARRELTARLKERLNALLRNFAP